MSESATIAAPEQAAAEKIRVRVKAWSRPGPAASAFVGAGVSHQTTALWRPTLASADFESVLARDELVARARDLIRNDGIAAATVQHAADLVVGHRWVLAAKPDWRALGIERQAARELGRVMEREFYAWAQDPRKHCDRRRRQTFASQLTLLVRQWVGAEGEGLAVLGFREEAQRLALGARYATCMEVIDPDRLGNPHGQVDTDLLRGGIALDEDGAPVGAHIRKGHMIDLGYSAKSFEWEYVPWENPGGRPIVLHVMDHLRAGQNRGLTPFAPILISFKQLAQLTDAELSNAVLNALFGAFVITGEDPKSIADALSIEGTESVDWNALRAAFYDAAPVRMNGLRLPVLLPGDEVQMNTSPRPTQPYVDIRAAFISTFASITGTSYEQVSRDYSRTNYSSSRAAANDAGRAVGGRRAQLGQNVASPVYFAVMQEAFDRGYITEPAGAPSFEEMPQAYCDALWIGPSLGSVDPVKDRQAAQIGMEIGVTTLEQVCAEEGVDYEDTLDQLAYEQEARAARGLPPVNPAIYGVAPPSDAPAQSPQGDS